MMTAFFRKHTALIVAGLFFLQPFFWQTIPQKFTLVCFALAAIISFFWLIGRRQTKKITIRLHNLAWLLLASFAIITSTVLQGITDISPWILFVTVVLSLLASASSEWLAASTKIILLYSLIHAIATLCFYFFPDIFDSFVKPRLFPDIAEARDYSSALTSHYSFNAMFCAVGLIFSFTHALYKKHKGWARVYSWFLVVIFLTSLVLTTKRAHLLVAVGAITLAYLLIKGARGIFKVVVFLGVCIIGTLSLGNFIPGVSSGIERLIMTFKATDFSEASTGRVFLWRHAIEGWQQTPLLGNGWGTYSLILPTNGQKATIAHNEFLNLLYHSGLVGTLLFVVGFIGSFFLTINILRTIQKDTDLFSKYGYFVMVSLTVQIFLLTYSGTSGELLSKPYTFILYFFSTAVSGSIAFQLTRKDQHYQTASIPREANERSVS